MYYKIYYLDDGVQKSLPNRFEEEEYKDAEKLVSKLNKNRKKKDDPYYWVACVRELIRGE